MGIDDRQSDLGRPRAGSGSYGPSSAMVAASPRLTIVSSLRDLEDPVEALASLSRACASNLAMDGAAIALSPNSHDPGSIAASDELASLVVELQFNVGEGPSIDAHRERRPIFEPQMSAATRWPDFASQVSASGVAAVFALPMQIGAASFGVLTFYRGQPGPLGDELLAEALAMADIACEVTLWLQSQVPPGSLCDVIDVLATDRIAVYQASGMIVVQTGVDVGQAMALLWARAYATGRSVHDVAAEVVARRFRFDR